jgi:alkylation response protein AidB-like acyl-CoA dehydrogenase
MDFGLTEEQQLLKDTVRRFLSDRCPTERVRQVMESDTGHDAELWAGLAELGITAIAVPEDRGGMGGEFLDLALVAEELGYAAVPGPFLGNSMATVALAEGEESEQSAALLERIASGACTATVAVGEAGSEWRADRFLTSVKAGRVTGEKMLVPFASISEALVVAARDAEGPGLWLVETAAEGVTVDALKVNDMTRRLDHVAFDEAPCERLGGRELFERVIDAGAVLIAADAYGGSARCVQMTRDYVVEREQFGQIIGAFQAVKHQLADLVADLEPSMSLYWYAAHSFDRIKDQSSKHASLAKAHAADLFDKVTRDATELHGGIGFTWEFDLHLWFRRAIFDRSFLGESSLHRSRAADLAGW